MLDACSAPLIDGFVDVMHVGGNLHWEKWFCWEHYLLNAEGIFQICIVKRIFFLRIWSSSFSIKIVKNRKKTWKIVKQCVNYTYFEIKNINAAPHSWIPLANGVNTVSQFGKFHPNADRINSRKAINQAVRTQQSLTTHGTLPTPIVRAPHQRLYYI